MSTVYASNTDLVGLLDAGENETVYHFGHYGSQSYRARQAFLRSYQFSIEVTFKEKLKRSARRLNEEPLEDLLKESVLKLKKAVKGFAERQYQKLIAVKVGRNMHLWPAACFRPSHGFGNHSVRRHAFVFS